MYKSKKSYTLEDARRKLENFCAYQERSYGEVTQKLKDMGMIPQASEVVLTHLIENDYLNEERFARAFCSGRFNAKNWGRNRIKYELNKRGVSKYNIRIALGIISNENYLGKFNELSENKWAQLSTIENLQKRKRKLADYLLYRGWESELVYDKISELSRRQS